MWLLFSAIIQNHMQESHWLFLERTIVMLTSGGRPTKTRHHWTITQESLYESFTSSNQLLSKVHSSSPICYLFTCWSFELIDSLMMYPSVGTTCLYCILVSHDVAQAACQGLNLQMQKNTIFNFSHDASVGVYLAERQSAAEVISRLHSSVSLLSSASICSRHNIYPFIISLALWLSFPLPDAAI